MQEHACCRKDHCHQGEGDSLSLSSSSKENHSPSSVALPPSSPLSSGISSTIHGNEVATIQNMVQTVTPTLVKIVERSAGAAPRTELEDIERILAYEDEMDAKVNKCALSIPIDVLIELPPQEEVIPHILHDL